MKMKYICSVLAVTLFAVACTKDMEQPKPSTEKPSTEDTAEFVGGEILVKFSPAVGEILEQAAMTRSAVTRSGVVRVDDVLAAFDTYQIERIFPYDAKTEERTRKDEMHLWYVVRFDEKYDAAEVARQLSALGEVSNATVNRTIKRAYNGKAKPLTREEMNRMKTTRAAAYQYNDELLSVQWNMVNRGDMFADKSLVGADAGCEEAWKLCSGDESIIVAVLDEGVDFEHPDLKNNMWINPNEVFHSHKDNDGNGYAGDVYGYNFAQNTGVITYEDVSDTGHGTHVAGVIAAQNNNGMGISSIAGGNGNKGGVKIMSCQIFSGNLAPNTLAEIKAIKYAADNGAVILQCSWGVVSGAANSYLYGPQGYHNEDEWVSYNPLEKITVDYFLHNAGSPTGVIEGGLAVFASGNENAPMAGFPGAYSECISVNATAADFTPGVYSNYGEYSNISAPGGDVDYYYDYGEGANRGKIGSILSTMPLHISETGYGYMEGTSMACPHVSGAIALGLSYANSLRRHYTADEFRKLLYQTCTEIDSYMTGTKFYYTYVGEFGDTAPRQLVLANYKGRMGGQVNTARLLKAVEGNGTPMSFPNLYVQLDAQVTAVPALYFVNGESMTYTVQVADSSVATAAMSGNKLTVKGVKTGTTQATITTSGGTTQKFTITVRKTANDNGWL